MIKLLEPTKELNKRILTEVDFEDRIIGFKLFKCCSGPIQTVMYSFEEVVLLLCDPHPRIDFNILEKWVRETMKDGELAGKIKGVNARNNSEQDKTLQIRDLMFQRLLQCKRNDVTKPA